MYKGRRSMPALFKYNTMTGAELKRRFDRIDFYATVSSIMAAKRNELVELQKEQLHKGIGRDGRYLSPKHSEDPYFKSRESALRYARWKKDLFPDSTYDVPNLFIVGVYHGSISIDVSKSDVRYQASATFAPDIDSKYGNNVLGLTDESKSSAWRELLRQPIVKELKQKTGL